MVFGFQFNDVLLGPSIVSGVSQAGLYGLLALALVLTYRVSRTVAFVHGGIAMLGAMLLWWTVFDSGNFTGAQPNLPKPLAVAFPLALGALIGAIYGWVVTRGRCADWPKLTLTVFSLGVLLVFMGAIPLLFYIPFGGHETPPSPFGDGRFTVLDTVVSVHQAATIGITVVVAVVITVVLHRTRGGLWVRSIADDVEAARWAGVPINRVGTAVYAGAGALSSLAGILIAPVLGPGFIDVLFVFLRALTCAVLGGFTSFSLALAGALLLGVLDSSLRTGLLGSVSGGQREMVTVGVVLLCILVLARFRRQQIDVIDAEGA